MRRNENCGGASFKARIRRSRGKRSGSPSGMEFLPKAESRAQAPPVTPRPCIARAPRFQRYDGAKKPAMRVGSARRTVSPHNTLECAATLAAFEVGQPLASTVALDEGIATARAVHFSPLGSSPRNVCRRNLFLSFPEIVCLGFSVVNVKYRKTSLILPSPVR